jgi:hypothetical protein
MEAAVDVFEEEWNRMDTTNLEADREKSEPSLSSRKSLRKRKQ